MTITQLSIMINQVCGKCGNDYVISNLIIVDAGSPGEFIQLDVVSTQGLRRRIKMAVPMSTQEAIEHGPAYR